MNKVKRAQRLILAWDLKGCIYLNDWSHQTKVADFFKCISRLGDGAFWLLMVFCLWVLQEGSYILELTYMLVCVFCSSCIYKLLKKRTLRPRPYQVHQVIRLGERPLDHFSFPSGHTLHAVMLTMVMGSIEPILLVVMLPFTILVALSRMILGLHYPSDVLMGALLGVVLAYISLSLDHLVGLSLLLP